MRNILRSLVLAPVVMAAALLATNSAMAATIVNVPFSFKAAGKTCPAGKYSVALDSNHNFVVLDSKETPLTLRWVANPGDASRKASEITLHFGKDDQTYSLEQVEVGQQSTPHLKNRSSHSEHRTIEGQGN
jgi:hypothetical protein